MRSRRRQAHSRGSELPAGARRRPRIQSPEHTRSQAPDGEQGTRIRMRQAIRNQLHLHNRRGPVRADVLRSQSPKRLVDVLHAHGEAWATPYFGHSSRRESFSTRVWTLQHQPVSPFSGSVNQSQVFLGNHCMCGMPLIPICPSQCRMRNDS